MPLSEEQRQRVEETIMDLHFTSQKYVDNGKEIHAKLLTMNVREAIEILEDIKADLEDDPKKFDYKMHMLLPFQLYEMIKLRSDKEEQ